MLVFEFLEKVTIYVDQGIFGSFRCCLKMWLVFNVVLSDMLTCDYSPCAPSIILKFQNLERVIELPDAYGGFEIILLMSQ